MQKRSPRRIWLAVLLLTLLSLAMPTAMSAQSAGLTLTPPQEAIAKTYSIDPGKMYPGSSVIQAIDKILQAAEAEAKASAQQSWDAGYKAGVLDWKPKYDGAQAEIAHWKDELTKTKKENLANWEGWQNQKKLTLYVGLGGLGLSLVAFIAGSLIF